MTPMIDVIFLLIIFFMTVTEMGSLEFSQDLTLPEAASAVVDRKAPGEKLVVNILRDGRYVVAGATRTETELRWDLERKARVAAGGAEPIALSVILRVDRAVPYGDVRRVLNSCAEFGIRDVSMHATLPREDNGA